MKKIESFAGENIWRARMLPMFEADQLMLFNWSLAEALDLRNMNADFGIVPLPKFDEEQKEYYSPTHPAYLSFMSIPVTNPDPETAAEIMETLNYLSQKLVIPAIYDVTLLDKVLRDEESVIMLDIIRENRVYDIGYIFNWGGASTFINSFITNNSTAFASAYTQNEPKILAALEQYL